MPIRNPYLFAALAVGATAAAIVARTSSGRTGDEKLAAQVTALAHSIERMKVDPSPPRVVEYHTTREVVTAPEPAVPAAREDGVAEMPAAGFDPQEVRDFAAKRGPHPIERRFERERPIGPAVEARRREVGGAIERAVEGTGADIIDVECRSATCRLEATFDSMEASNLFFDQMFLRSERAEALLGHGGVYATTQEPSGDRHHSVFYVSTNDGGSLPPLDLPPLWWTG